MSSVFTVFDGVRVISEWTAAGSLGNGPLQVPYPAKARGGFQPRNQRQATEMVLLQHVDDAPKGADY